MRWTAKWECGVEAPVRELNQAAMADAIAALAEAIEVAINTGIWDVRG